MTGSSSDRAVKRERLARLRSQAGVDAIALTSPEAVSWYLEGVRTHVSLAGPPVIAVRADASGDTILTPVSERDRLVAEELLPEDAERVVAVDWRTPVAEAPQLAGAVAEGALAAPLRAARARLLPAETARYRELGGELAGVLTEVSAGLTSQHAEQDAAAAVTAALAARGIDPVVVLVAGGERLSFRHPLPGPGPIGARALIVVCARRHGLIANASRWVALEPETHEDILAVEAAYLDATVPGARVADVLAAGAAAYRVHGFAADEWLRHHQGGPAGYAGRDPRATPAVPDIVQEDHAFTWNPSAPGRKVEDTVLTRAGGIEVLTADPRWPAVEFAGRARPLEWTLPR